MRLLRGIGRLWTSMRDGPIDRAALVVDDDRIRWAGAEAALPVELRRSVTVEDAVGGALVTPGLIDAHTHPVYAGDRFAELALRSSGAGYEAIARAGGGIASTVRQTRAKPWPALEEEVADRLRRWLAEGTTTVEVKSGYHLDRAGELAAVALLARLAARRDLPRLDVTFLAAHGVPPDWLESADAYADAVAAWMPEAAAAGARWADVFCDRGYFSVEQARRVLTAGRGAGLLLRLHADELGPSGGSRLAAELGAASADHLLAIDEGDARALGTSGVVAVLAPATALAMGRLPPVELLRKAGVTLALASDHNPGQTGITSMSLVVALAVAALGMPVDEALRAATVGGAGALRRSDRGVIRRGALADLVAWDADHEGAFAWAWGLGARAVWRGGEPVVGNVAPGQR